MVVYRNELQLWISSDGVFALILLQLFCVCIGLPVKL